MRGHCYAGASFVRQEARHYGLETSAIIAIVGVAVSAAGAGYSAYAASEAQASAADYNKKLAENQAALAQQAADIDADTMKEKNRRLQALQLTEQGGSGVETESGSPLLVRADTARQMQRDIYLTKYGGYVHSSGYLQQAGLQGLYAQNYHRGAEIGAGVSLLSSGSALAAQNYYGRYGGYYADRDIYARSVGM